MAVFCDTDTPEYVQQDCSVERAGIVAVGLIDESVGTPSDANLMSATYWNNLLNQSPPLAYRIRKTRGEYPRPTVISEEGFGREAKQNTGADHIVNWEVEGIEDNRDFFESVNRRKWKTAFITAQDLMYYVDVPVTHDGRINNPKDIKAAAFWMVEAAWTEFSNPRVVDVSGITTFQE
jgi:hypothetical protein